MRNALLGFLLASTGILGLPMLLLAMYIVTHWLTIVLFAVAVVMVAVIATFIPKPSRLDPALTRHREFHTGAYAPRYPDLCPFCSRGAGRQNK